MVKFYFIALLLLSVVTAAQAQQSAFQGTWIGERSSLVDRSAHRLEISGNSWQHYYNNEIQAAGTARFSTGNAELLLANGNIYFNLTLLAPGLIEQPITMWNGLYRFRNTGSPNQINPTDNRPLINIVNRTGYTIFDVYIKSNSSNNWGNDILYTDQVLQNGQSVNIRLGQPLDVTNRYDIWIIDFEGDSYAKWNVLVSNNVNIVFTFDDFVR